MTGPRWRTGRHNDRIVYEQSGSEPSDDDRMVATFFDAEDAARAVAAERDLAAARAENEQTDRDADAWKGVALAARQGVAEAEAERDAARSQLAEARAWLARVEPYPERNGDHFRELREILEGAAPVPPQPEPDEAPYCGTRTDGRTCVLGYRHEGQHEWHDAPAVQPVEAPTEERATRAACPHGELGRHVVVVGHHVNIVGPYWCPGPVSQSEASTGGQQ